MQTVDPTLTLLADLDDPTKFTRIPNVPVSRPHRRSEQDPDGKTVEVEVHADDLPELAEKINRPFRESGDPVRVTIGHVQQTPGFPENKQPPLIGFAKNAKPGTFGPANIPGLLCDLYIRRGEESALRRYPFRSMELDPQTGRIHGIALTLRSPWLDLGALHYSAGRWLVTYEGQTMEPNGSPAGGAGGAGAGAGPSPGGDWTPDDDVQYAKFCKYMNKYEAGPGMAAMGATNGALPAGAGEPPPSMPYSKTNPLIAGLDAQLSKFDADQAQAARAAVAAEATDLLDRLKTRVKFAYADEHAALCNYATTAERVAHVQKMLVNYTKLPTGPMLPVQPNGVTPSGGLPDGPQVPANYGKTVQYMLANPGMSYEKAEAHVLAASH